MPSHRPTTRESPVTPPIVLVTGASDGIGRAMAVELARRGAVVLVHGRDADRARQVIDRLDRLDNNARVAFHGDHRVGTR